MNQERIEIFSDVILSFFLEETICHSVARQFPRPMLAASRFGRALRLPSPLVGPSLVMLRVDSAKALSSFPWECPKCRVRVLTRFLPTAKHCKNKTN